MYKQAREVYRGRRKTKGPQPVNLTGQLGLQRRKWWRNLSEVYISAAKHLVMDLGLLLVSRKNWSVERTENRGEESKCKLESASPSACHHSQPLVPAESNGCCFTLPPRSYSCTLSTHINPEQYRAGDSRKRSSSLTKLIKENSVTITFN